jgi:hypothetical protein
MISCAIAPFCFARDHVITNARDLVQLNRALPPGQRLTDTSLVALNLALASGQRRAVVTDTSLAQINRALEDAGR